MPSAARTPLAGILLARIRERGPISFAEYMQECLYHPGHGYYSRGARGRMADYFTSVDVHSIFGRLLARQLAEMWELLGRPRPFCLAEAGAGSGRLAAQILDFAAAALTEMYAALEYHAIERSAARRAAMPQLLAGHAAAGRIFFSDSLPERIAAGCIFSNELLDALPVSRVLMQDGVLREIRVGARGEELCDVIGPPAPTEVSDYFRAQGITLREGQQAEVCLEAARWIEDAGRRLGRGFVLTIDYGHDAAELYNERHMRGTLLAYRAHRAGEDFYAAPGEQDLTAHVNFTALDLAGRRAGLERTGRVPQWHFLLALGRRNEFADLYDPGMSETDRLMARLKLKTLIFPEGMGETFQVFVQHKGIEAPCLTGLGPL